MKIAGAILSAAEIWVEYEVWKAHRDADRIQAYLATPEADFRIREILPEFQRRLFALRTMHGAREKRCQGTSEQERAACLKEMEKKGGRLLLLPLFGRRECFAAR